MKKITIELQDADFETLEQFLEDMGGNVPNGPPLTPETVASLLIQDVLLAAGRPGSWEGSNMWKVLQGHGYGL